MDVVRLRDGEIEVKNFLLEDATPLFHLVDKNRDYLRQWLPWLDVTKTEEDSQKFIADALKKYDEKTGADFGIWYQEILVGAIGFHDINIRNRKSSIGYWLAADYQGKGIMTTACKLVLSYGFTDLQLNRIETKCATGNTKSCAIPLRLGFVKEGTLRETEWLYDHFVDHDVYSMLVSDWK